MDVSKKREVKGRVWEGDCTEEAGRNIPLRDFHNPFSFINICSRKLKAFTKQAGIFLKRTRGSIQKWMTIWRHNSDLLSSPVTQDSTGRSNSRDLWSVWWVQSNWHPWSFCRAPEKSYGQVPSPSCWRCWWGCPRSHSNPGPLWPHPGHSWCLRDPRGPALGWMSAGPMRKSRHVWEYPHRPWGPSI